MPSEKTLSEGEPTASPSSNEKLPFKEKVAFGAGEFTNRYGENGVNDIATPIYNIILGVSPGIIGMILGLMRLWDAITDPIMGYISDNWKGKWGRRKPFLLIGSLCMAVAYPLIWFASPDWTEHAKTIYLFGTAIIFFTTYTIYSVPFRALATEMTPDYEERTGIRVYSAFFNKIYMLALPWVFPIAQWEVWGDPVTGIRLISGISSIFLIAAGVTCAIFPKERYHKVAVKQKRVALLPSFLSLIKDPPFLMLHGVGIGLLSSILLVGTLGLYVNMYYVWQGDTLTGSTFNAYVVNILQILGFVMLYVIAKYLTRFEKRKLINAALLLALGGTIARWFIYNQDYPRLVLLDPFFFAPAYTIFWAVFLSMLGDYCDYDEHRNGQRREGIFGAMSGWIMKAGASLALITAGLVIDWTGFDKDLGGAQPEGTLLKMRLALMLLPGVCLLAAIILNTAYPLTKDRMAQIREDLEARRGVV
jgi:GPH family glycoside/pentoside/hexuronide:cation symporter